MEYGLGLRPTTDSWTRRMNRWPDELVLVYMLHALYDTYLCTLSQPWACCQPTAPAIYIIYNIYLYNAIAIALSTTAAATITIPAAQRCMMEDQFFSRMLLNVTNLIA